MAYSTWSTAGELLEQARALLKQSKRYDRRGETSCRFNYVNLKRSVPEHAEFWRQIDSIANTLRLQAVYPRLSEYVVGDFCEEHIDTIPNIVKAVSVRYDEGKWRLRVGTQLRSEGGGRINIFDPHIPHAVLPIETGSRIVLVFWLIKKES